MPPYSLDYDPNISQTLRFGAQEKWSFALRGKRDSSGNATAQRRLQASCLTWRKNVAVWTPRPQLSLLQ